MAQYNGPPPKWDVSKLKKLRLFGKPWDPKDPRQAPSISLHVVNGNPRFRMYLNKGGTGSAIPIAFDPVIFTYVTEVLLDIANNNEPDKIGVDIKASWVNGQKLDKPATTSRVTFGRGADGVVFMSVQVKGEAQAVFEFLPNYFAELIGADGEPLSRTRASTLCARGWSKWMADFVRTFMVVHTTDPDVDKDKTQGGNSFGGGGGRNKPAFQDGGSGFDDDIAF